MTPEPTQDQIEKKARTIATIIMLAIGIALIALADGGAYLLMHDNEFPIMKDSWWIVNTIIATMALFIAGISFIVGAISGITSVDDLKKL